MTGKRWVTRLENHTQDAVDAGADPRRPHAALSRSRPAHATTRRKDRDERRAGLASAASNWFDWVQPGRSAGHTIPPSTE